MFALAIFFGILSNLIFILGILGILYKPLVIIVTLISFVVFILIFSKTENTDFKIPKLDKASKLFVFLIAIQAVVNFIGVLGPEVGFDALWYHLTLPKVFLIYHKIFHIPGGLLYYSDLPKLGETFYISALSFGNEIFAKMIHYVFGILCLISIYKVGTKFTTKKFALLASLIFYSNLVVGWESISAYIDLIRTFFEITAFWAFIEWIEKKDNKLLYESAVILGLAVSTKLIAAGSMIIFMSLIIYNLRNNRRLILPSILKYVLIVFFVTLPWLFYSFLNTGNPIYPLFTNYYHTGLSFNLLNPLNAIRSIAGVFIKAQDPISPIYVIVIPLVVIIYKKLLPQKKNLIIYSLLSVVVWYFTPQTGGGRFILPYLAVMSVLSVVIIENLKHMNKYLILIVLFISLTSIGYRTIANAKYIPVILGWESRNVFMAKNLNFSYGDFYDTDGFFKSFITSRDKVLLYGFHNLYYVDFPFVDASYVSPGETFNFIATQNTPLPARFSQMNLVYFNKITKVSLYTNKGNLWEY